MAASVAFKVYLWVAGVAAPALYSANMHYNAKLRQEFPNSFNVQLGEWEPASRWSDAMFCAGKSAGLALAWPLVLGDIALTGFQPKHMRSLICPGYYYSNVSQFYDGLFDTKKIDSKSPSDSL